eukprot:g1381.t1
MINFPSLQTQEETREGKASVNEELHSPFPESPTFPTCTAPKAKEIKKKRERKKPSARRRAKIAARAMRYREGILGILKPERIRSLAMSSSLKSIAGQKISSKSAALEEALKNMQLRKALTERPCPSSEALLSLSPPHFSDLVAAMTCVRGDEGAAFFFQGEESRDAYIIVKGEISIRRCRDDGLAAPVVLDHMGPGAVFGEFSMLFHTPRTSDVIVSKGPCFCLKLSSDNLTMLRIKHVGVYDECFPVSGAAIAALKFKSKRNDDILSTAVHSGSSRAIYTTGNESQRVEACHLAEMKNRTTAMCSSYAISQMDANWISNSERYDMDELEELMLMHPPLTSSTDDFEMTNDKEKCAQVEFDNNCENDTMLNTTSAPPPPPPLVLHRLQTDMIPEIARMAATENTKHRYMKMIADKNGLKQLLRKREIGIAEYRGEGRKLGKRFQRYYSENVDEIETTLYDFKEKYRQEEIAGNKKREEKPDLLVMARSGETIFYKRKQTANDETHPTPAQLRKESLEPILLNERDLSSAYGLVGHRIHPITPSSKGSRSREA